MIHSKPQQHRTTLDFNGEKIEVVIHYQIKDTMPNIVTIHDLDGNIISIYDFDEVVEKELILELMGVKNSIYDYKINEHVPVVSFGQKSEMVVIGHDEKTNQVRLKCIDGNGSSYWSIEKLRNHINRFKSL